MRLIFAGTPEPAVIALKKLLASEHEVVAVITRPDAPKGRGRKLQASPVATIAREHGIEVLVPQTLKADTDDGEAIRNRIRELAPDCVPVVAYGNLLPGDILAMVPHGFINLHFSLLPRWRGAAPVQSAIAAGDDETGATTFRIDSGLDTGEILATVTEAILPQDTSSELLERLAIKGADLLVQTMDGLAEGSITPVPQRGEPTYAAKIQVADAQVQWQEPAEKIDRMIRAVTPAPGAWTLAQGLRLKLDPIQQVVDVKLSPGEVQVEKKRVLVGTGTVAVALTKVHPPGKKLMNATDWARGLQDVEGVRFE